MTIKIRFLKRNSCIIFFDKILCVYSNTQLNIEKTDGKITKLFLEIELSGGSKWLSAVGRSWLKEYIRSVGDVINDD
jgi:hypothetical protein